ncbi:hypothetical protein FIV22_14555 [Lactiplantibacillus plantarum]|nr:hypothetical protein [Lactiplantibacillus plantarum]
MRRPIIVDENRLQVGLGLE